MTSPLATVSPTFTSSRAMVPVVSKLAATSFTASTLPSAVTDAVTSPVRTATVRTAAVSVPDAVRPEAISSPAPTTTASTTARPALSIHCRRVRLMAATVPAAPPGTLPEPCERPETPQTPSMRDDDGL